MEKMIENLGEIAREIVEDHTDCDIYPLCSPIVEMQLCYSIRYFGYILPIIARDRNPVRLLLRIC